MFIYLDKKRDKLNKWLQKKTTLDFSDCGMFILFIIGLFAIFYLKKISSDANQVNAVITLVVLWITAIAILQYTKEAFWLKQAEQKTLKELRSQKELEMKPYIKLIWLNDEKTIKIKNIGKGIARQITLSFSADEEDKKNYYDKLGCENISALANGESENASFYDKSTIFKIEPSDETFIFHMYPGKPDGHGYKIYVNYTEIDPERRHEAIFKTSWTNKDKYIIEKQ